MKNRFVTASSYFCFLLLGFCFRASAQYYVDWYTIDGGGGTSTGHVYSVSGTIGQPDAGPPMSGTQYSVVGGFWSLYAQSVPSVQATLATSATTNSVTVNATVNPDGLTSLVYVQWGTTTNYGSFSVTNTLPAGTTNVSINIALTGLTPLTVYHYRIVAVNSSGTSYSSDFTFETLSPYGGTWSPLAQTAPGAAGIILLLSDGSVIAENDDASNTFGPGWFRLTPDIHGSYANGTWSTLSSMHYKRHDVGSAVLRDGRLFVVGGEYGNGHTTAEVYDPLLDSWSVFTPPPAMSPVDLTDCDTAVLPDGSVMIAPIYPFPNEGTAIFHPDTGTFSLGPASFDQQAEASWVKLPDDSILSIDNNSLTNSERYIPSLNQWVKDTSLPFPVYSPEHEIGGAFLLPNGNAIFLGGSGHMAIYTPTGTTNAGTWTAGADMPAGLGAMDAPAAMLPNGKILCSLSPRAAIFQPPATFYEYDYASNTFTQVNAPGGGVSFDLATFLTYMLVLPDGSVLLSDYTSQLYLYKPVGPSLPAGKPTITALTTNMDGTFHLTGTLFNGISAGAVYGDDGQMDTDYPLVRLTNSQGQVYYCRTFNWSDTGVMTGSKPVSTEFTLPAPLPLTNYWLSVVANGISSDPISLSVGRALGVTPQGLVHVLGTSGGLFTPPSQTYFLTNISFLPLQWSVGCTSNWLNIYPPRGTILPGGGTTVVVTPSSYLAVGTYDAELLFTNLTENSVQIRGFEAQVQPLVLNGGFSAVSLVNGQYEPLNWQFVSGTTANNFATPNIVNGIVPRQPGSWSMLFGETNSPCILRQVLPTIPNRVYLLSLWLDSPDGLTPSYFGVSWDGNYVYQATNLPASGGWTNLLFIVRASSSATPLEIAARDDPSVLGVTDVSAILLPTIQSASAVAGTISFVWNAIPGPNYQLQYRTNLANGVWQNLGSPIGATNAVLSGSDTIGPDPQRFYRVVPVP